jgi:hypothetical protein
MKGMIDGRRLKRAWDNHELGPLLVGDAPYDYEPDVDAQARFTRLRQVTDFLRCRTQSERQPRLVEALPVLETNPEPWAKAMAIFLKHSFGDPASGERQGEAGDAPACQPGEQP